jgi:hypothetical protein
MRAIGDITHQPRRSKAAYVSSRLNCLERPFLPTSPGGADSMNEATVACFDAMFSVCLSKAVYGWSFGGMS